jgi:hypothetical protein
MGDPEKAADQYRHRAEEYRLAAEIAKNPSARDNYLHVAKVYDVLAERADRRAKAMRISKDSRLS